MSWLVDKTFFDQPVKDDLRTYGKIQKTATGQVGDYTTGVVYYNIPISKNIIRWKQ